MFFFVVTNYSCISCNSFVDRLSVWSRIDWCFWSHSKFSDWTNPGKCISELLSVLIFVCSQCIQSSLGDLK